MPKDLDQLVQRAGRGGRNSDQICRIVLLLQPNAVKTAKGQPSREGTDRADDAPQREGDGNDAEEDGGGTTSNEPAALDNEDLADAAALREFCTTEECLWEVLHKHYSNPDPEGRYHTYSFHMHYANSLCSPHFRLLLQLQATQEPTTTFSTSKHRCKPRLQPRVSHRPRASRACEVYAYRMEARALEVKAQAWLVSSTDATGYHYAGNPSRHSQELWLCSVYRLS